MAGFLGVRAAANAGPGSFISANNTNSLSGSGIYPISGAGSSNFSPSLTAPGGANLGVGNDLSRAFGNSSGARGFGLGGPQGYSEINPDWARSQPSTNSSGSGNSGNNSGSSSSGGKGKSKRTSRNIDTNRRAKAEYKKDKELSNPWKADERIKKLVKDDGEMFMGIKDLSKEGSGGNNTGGGFPLDDIPPLMQGAMRDLSAQVSSMEQLLSKIPDNILGQFINNLPAELQSFLPPGLIPGLTNSGPFNLNALLKLAGAGSLGNAAGQMLRSVLPGIPLTNAIQQITNIPLQNASQELGINQIAQVFSQINNSTSTSYAALANSLSSVQQLAGIASNAGIPISTNTLNQAFTTSLQSAGLAQQIPANISGLANGITNNPLGSILNAAMGGMNGGFPVLPASNSLGFNSSLLSGLGQFLPADVAKNLFSPNQLQNMLPGNLQNIIPQVAPIFSQGFENAISSIANAAPQMSPNSNQPGGGNGGSGCKHADPSNEGKSVKDTRYIDYTEKLSETFSIFHLTTGSGVAAGRYPLEGNNVDKIVKNLSGLAENVLEPLKSNYPGFTVMSGYRDEGDHKEGKCVDVGWSCSPAKLQEIASWIQKSLPVKEVQMNWQKIGWLHIKYEQGGCGSSAQTNNPSGGVTSGLVNNIQSGLSALA